MLLRSLLLIQVLVQLMLSAHGHAADVAPVVGSDKESVPENSKGSHLGIEGDKDKKSRNFYQVLEETMADFEYDVKTGQVTGLKNLAVRNIVTSENVPPSFKQHLELLSTEKIVRNSKTRMVQCLACRAKRATLTGDNVTISSPESNPAELTRIAKMNGIENFVDIAFSYQPSGMILSYYIVDADNGTILWSKSYNSETTRAAAFRRGVDYNQADQDTNRLEYAPAVMIRPSIYYFSQPDIKTTASVIGLGFRMVERYDNRKKEVGFEANYMLNTSTLVGATSNTQSLYSGLNLTLLFIHSWNLWGEVENYHQVRNSIFIGGGGTYGSGFLGALIRTGYEFRFGKHWILPVSLGYRPSANSYLSGSSSGTVSGVEIGLGVSAGF